MWLFSNFRKLELLCEMLTLVSLFHPNYDLENCIDTQFSFAVGNNDFLNCFYPYIVAIYYFGFVPIVSLSYTLISCSIML